MIVYSNSCSFGSIQEHVIYPELVSTELKGKLLNEGIPGSCNRRIIRSSIRSLIDIRKHHIGPVLALIGLTFISRTELWQPHLPSNGNDGDFHPITSLSIKKLDWSTGLVNTKHNVYEYADSEVKNYYKQWLLHFSKEAEVTNLLTDIIMFESFAKSNGIDCLIFCNCQKFPSLPEVSTSAPFLNSLVEFSYTKNSIIDLWNFSFADFALDNGYQPKDYLKYGANGHPGKVAHEKFGFHLLEIYKTNITKE